VMFHPNNEDIFMLQDDNTVWIINKNKVCLYQLQICNIKFFCLPSSFDSLWWLLEDCSIMHKAIYIHISFTARLPYKVCSSLLGSYGT